MRIRDKILGDCEVAAAKCSCSVVGGALDPTFQILSPSGVVSWERSGSTPPTALRLPIFLRAGILHASMIEIFFLSPMIYRERVCISKAS